MQTISAVETAIVAKLRASTTGIKEMSYGYYPEGLAKTPAISVCSIHGKYRRVTDSEFELTFYPTISIVYQDLKNDMLRRHFISDLMLTIVSILTNKTFNEICTPLKPVDWLDEFNEKEPVPGTVYYRQSFETSITVSEIPDTDTSLVLDKIYTTYKILPDDVAVLTGITDV